MPDFAGKEKREDWPAACLQYTFFVFFTFGNSEFGIWISTTRASIISFLTEGKLFFVLFIFKSVGMISSFTLSSTSISYAVFLSWYKSGTSL